jgi:hypothetical protein
VEAQLADDGFELRVVTLQMGWTNEVPVFSGDITKRNVHLAVGNSESDGMVRPDVPIKGLKSRNNEKKEGIYKTTCGKPRKTEVRLDKQNGNRQVQRIEGRRGTSSDLRLRMEKTKRKKLTINYRSITVEVRYIIRRGMTNRRTDERDRYWNDRYGCQ